MSDVYIEETASFKSDSTTENTSVDVENVSDKKQELGTNDEKKNANNCDKKVILSLIWWLLIWCKV